MSGVLLTVLLVSVLVPVARATASAFTVVQEAYATSPSQTIAPCKFSPGVLAQAQSSVPNDAQQYDQNLIAAIEQARQAQANGACTGKKHGAANANVPVGTPAPPPVPPLGQSTPLRVGSATAATDAGLPAPLTILAILAGLALVAGAAFAVARLRGWEPGWVARWGHSWREAGYRVSGAWSEFGRWVRGITH
ncbi:MAG TPA: hypothetical protein VG388_11905 [Solirubrobacteraceae bacterium]|nr:hypothetical protein [Solirubrobacteraceae bacterium]